MKKYINFILFVLFFCTSTVFAADYDGDKRADELAVHGGSVASTTKLFIPDPVDVDIITTATFQELVTAVLSSTYDSSTKMDNLFLAQVPDSLFDANTILYATSDNTPAALVVGEQTVVGRVTAGAIAALSIDSDLSSVSANDDTLASAKAIKTALDAKESSTSNDFNPDRLAGDTTPNNLIDEAIIDAAIARDSELHVAATIAAGTNAIAISTQEFSADSKLEILADNSGSPNFNGVTPTFLSLVLGVPSVTSGVLDFKNATNNYTLGIKPGTTSQDWDITLPTAPSPYAQGVLYSTTGGVWGYLDAGTLGGTPALNTVGNAADAWAVNSGTYVHVITVGTSGEWRWGVDAANYISIINDGGVMRLKPVGTSTIDTGTITVATDSIHAQTGTTADDDMYLAAYDSDDTVYKNMLILKAANTVYGYLGNATNGWRWDENGALVPQGTASIDLPAGTVAAADLADADFGDFTVSSGSATLDTGVVLANEIGAIAEQKDWSILSPDGDDTFLFKAQRAITITDIHCIATGGGTITIDIQECGADGSSCTTIDAAITCDADGAADDGTLTNGAIDANDWVYLDMGTVSGTVNHLAFSIFYTEDK